jgi:ATP-dependent RNA helicase DOB1
VTDADPPQKHYIVDVLIKVASDSVVEKKTTTSGLSPPPAGDAGRVVIIGVLLTTVQAISQLRIKLPQDLRSQEQKNTAYKAIGEIKKRMPNGPALLDPIKNMGINDKSFRDLIKVCQICSQWLMIANRATREQDPDPTSFQLTIASSTIRSV